jgi:hypothetical protein
LLKLTRRGARRIDGRKQKMRSYIIEVGAAALLAVAGGVGCSGSSAGPGGGGPNSAVASASSQGDARALAEQSDLPAIATADRLLITEASGKAVTISTQAGLDGVRTALVVAHTPPSGGETWATLQWFKGETKVREVWVYGNGEWGVDRPGTSWTLGRSAALAVAITSLLKGG